jgi:hypothetical protein
MRILTASKGDETRNGARARKPVLRLACAAIFLGSGGVHATVEPAFLTRTESLRLEARAHEHGEGVPRNPLRAVELYCEAARLGDVEAQFSLGWMYANGRGMPRDDAMAAFFFGLAGAQGHEHASRMLRYVGEEIREAPECFQERRQAAASVASPHPEPLPRVDPSEPERARPDPVEEEPDVLDVSLARTKTQKQIVALVNELAPQYGVSPRLAFAVIRHESNFDPAARSEKNAQGLMQLIPETAARFNVTKPFDPVQNIRGGLAYLRWLLAYFRGHVPLVLAAYNAGEGAVNRHLGVPPFAETRAYVKRIMDFFGRDHHPYDPAASSPSPVLPRIRQDR